MPEGKEKEKGKGGRVTMREACQQIQYTLHIVFGATFFVLKAKHISINEGISFQYFADENIAMYVM